MTSDQDYLHKHLEIVKRFWHQMGLATDDLLEGLEDNVHASSGDPVCVALHNLLWGKYFATEGELIKAKRHIMAAEKAAQDLVRTTVLTIRKNDLYAYCLHEKACFYKMLYDYEHAKHYLNMGLLFSESEGMVALIRCTQEVYRFHRFYDDVSQGDLRKLSEYLGWFRKAGIELALVHGLYNRFAINVDLGDYDEAYNDYFDGTALAESMKLDTYQAAFEMGIGYMAQKQREFQRALEHYDQASRITQSWLRKSLCWENISTVYEHYKNYDKALSYQLRSLDVCEKHGVLCNIAADCYYIGKSYENNYHDLRKAQFYYKKGHDLAVKLREEGLQMSAFNQKIISQFTEFITQYYSVMASDDSCEDYLRFALNSSWREIKDTFHYSLIMYHRAQTESSTLLLKKLGLKMSTLQAIQKRLSESGFNIPDFRYHYSRGVVPELVPGLENYLKLIEDLQWKEANDRFETDVISMLLKKCNYNKSLLRENLKLSYATVISLTRGMNGYNHNGEKETG